MKLCRIAKMWNNQTVEFSNVFYLKLGIEKELERNRATYLLFEVLQKVTT